MRPRSTASSSISGSSRGHTLRRRSGAGIRIAGDCRVEHHLDHRHRVRRRHHRSLAVAGAERAERFILTTLLGIAGAFLATFIGQTIGWYRLDQGAGLIGATVGALIVLVIWNRLVVHHVVSDPGGSGPNAGPTNRP